MKKMEVSCISLSHNDSAMYLLVATAGGRKCRRNYLFGAFYVSI